MYKLRWVMDDLFCLMLVRRVLGYLLDIRFEMIWEIFWFDCLFL